MRSAFPEIIVCDCFDSVEYANAFSPHRIALRVSLAVGTNCFGFEFISGDDLSSHLLKRRETVIANAWNFQQLVSIDCKEQYAGGAITFSHSVNQSFVVSLCIAHKLDIEH